MNKWHEVYRPSPNKEYWGVIDLEKEVVHYFKTKEDAYNYSSWHHIPDINVFKESHD